MQKLRPKQENASDDKSLKENIWALPWLSDSKAMLLITSYIPSVAIESPESWFFP